MDSNQMYDLIIVGGGPAGLTAGIYANQIVLAAADECTAALACAHYVEAAKMKEKAAPFSSWP